MTRCGEGSPGNVEPAGGGEELVGAMFATCCMVGLLSGYLSALRNSANVKCLLSLVFSIDFLGDEFNIVVEAEDAGDEEEGLGDIDQQAVEDIVNHDDLISNQRNAAHDEQHRTGILRDFKSRVFHSIRFVLH